MRRDDPDYPKIKLSATEIFREMNELPDGSDMAPYFRRLYELVKGRDSNPLPEGVAIDEVVRRLTELMKD